MALQGGHRFAVSMADLAPFGLYAMDVVQAEDYDEKTGRRSPTKDKATGELVWTVTVIDRDPAARDKQIKVKVTGPHMPVLPGEIAPDTGLHAVEFVGLTATPYVVEAVGGRRPRLAYSFRATGMVAQGKALSGSATQTGRSGGPAPNPSTSGASAGDGRAA